MRMRYSVLILSLGMCVIAGGAYAVPQVFTFQQGVSGYTGFEDTSIFSESTNSGGGTDGIFAGRNNTGNLRRALLRADLSSIPAGSTITSVTLDLSVNMAPNATAPNTFELHQLLANWGEGNVVGAMGGGQGGAVVNGDATWVSNLHGASTWTTPGGDFTVAPSASVVSGASGTVTTWTSAGMVADVQGWVDAPATNFGWIVVGPETTNQKLRRFDSSEALSLQPVLTIVADVPPPAPSTNFAGIAVLTASLLVLAVWRITTYRKRHA